MASGSCSISPSDLKRAQAMPGAGRNPWPPCNQKSTGKEPQVQPNHPASPARWRYSLYVLSPVTGLYCHRRRTIRLARLGLSVGRPGPYDFAVRISAVRPHDKSCASPPRPSHPASRLVTIAHTPLSLRRDGWTIRLILPSAKQKYFPACGLTGFLRCHSSGKSVHGKIAANARGRRNSMPIDRCRRTTTCCASAMRDMLGGLSIAG